MSERKPERWHKWKRVAIVNVEGEPDPTPDNPEPWIGSPYDIQDKVEQERRRTLMAAAPKLLAACQELLTVLSEPGVMDVDEWKAWKRHAEENARAAILEATGGTE